MLSTIAAIDALDSCANRIKVMRDLVLESINLGCYLPEDKEERKWAERADRYLEAVLDVADAALREYRDDARRLKEYRP